MTDSHDDRPTGQADSPQAPQATSQTDNSLHSEGHAEGQGEGQQAPEAKKRSRGRRGGRGRKRKPAGEVQLDAQASPQDQQAQHDRQ